ncbi:MAG: hypothetical protein A2942_00695 [Candidatus Lloydbacteria bacterium RIFCSPLOWO2_01_FULL_50_20]|uniref:Uncharacterized protein n=1 Tax=Candidatus Lloydbacteria bacterium RIFCSPLOWO2_01_FULL_50_20 TaxID=1798665 RepID=A0A1G2DFE4_9BACT|nr:MAG: hypothetical protein A2942_00695 [Candidatus Lloydbacteria bacterium RIFCSPLOWO2_01_FULL_50_20]
MGRVWFIVFLSMCLVFGASWLWHLSDYRAEANRNNAINNAVTRETEAIAYYRDILKDQGKEAAAGYLATSSDIYGN